MRGLNRKERRGTMKDKIGRYHSTEREIAEVFKSKLKRIFHISDEDNENCDDWAEENIMNNNENIIIIA